MNSYEVPYPIERTLIRYAFSIVCLLCVSYGAFVISAVFHIVDRKQAETESIALAATLGSLEETYLSLERSLTAVRAEELGFVPPVSTYFTKRSGAGRSLSLDSR